jgi:hypothetical protein
MSLTLTFGWWLAPAAVTLIAFGAWLWFGLQQLPGAGYPSQFAGGVFLLVGFFAAATLSLFAWLIWSLLA